MYLSLTLLLVYCSISLSDETLPRGHLLPLGSHMSPILVEVIEEFPDPLTFHSKYVQKQWPVVLKGLLSTTDVISNWQSDSYLKSKFGDIEIDVEFGKKENRSEPSDIMSFREFLDVYNTSDIYMVSDMSDEMKNEWPFPNFLLCGGYTENLKLIVVWFSSGGTKSVLHTDSSENFHCVVSGRKEFVMFEPQYSQDIGPEHNKKGHYDIDVERVDLIKYPNISRIQWYKATVEPGDCLYLPYLWIHHVQSYGRNMGVNVWWAPFHFEEEKCKDIQHEKGFVKVNQFDVKKQTEVEIDHFEIKMQLLLKEAQRPDGTIHSTDVLKTIKKRNGNTNVAKLSNSIFNDVFEILLPGCKGILHERDLHGDRIPKANYKIALKYIGNILMEDMYTDEEDYSEGEEYPYVREEL